MIHPDSLAGLSQAERLKVLATVSKMEKQLFELVEDRRISQGNALLLLHDVEMVQSAVRDF